MKLVKLGAGNSVVIQWRAGFGRQRGTKYGRRENVTLEVGPHIYVINDITIILRSYYDHIKIKNDLDFCFCLHFITSLAFTG